MAHAKVVRETGLKYMMAETVVYSREFLYIRELYDKGELGKIQGWAKKWNPGCENFSSKLRQGQKSPNLGSTF